MSDGNIEPQPSTSRELPRISRIPMAKHRLSSGTTNYSPGSRKSSLKNTSSPGLSKKGFNVDTNKVYSSFYNPSPYVFRLPTLTNIESSDYFVKCPPFHVQLDHTLAVVWLLFADKTKVNQLGITQLHWALNFLRSIVNRKGENPKDVRLCIEVIEELLLNNYAEMCASVHLANNKQKIVNTLYQNPISILSSASLKENSEQVIISAPNAPANFSVNYYDLSKTYTMNKKFVHSNQLNHFKKADKFATIEEQVAEISPDKLQDFLHSWRQNQVKKIETELQNLQIIEHFISDLEVEVD